MKKILLKFLIGWAVNMLGLYICSAYLFDNFNYNGWGGWQGLLVVSLIFTVVMIIAKPLLKILSLPFYFISPVLFVVFYSFILYGITFLPQKWLDPIDIKTALFAGIAMMVVNVLASIFK
ncbi:MAG TPA: phage holin family protein [Patescibacteria group bacterium]|nr:phage holin family protein [Patescibacteria group bacterium]